MTRSVLTTALIIYSLLAVSTGVGATCEACPNCDYDHISTEEGNACLNYWTCEGDTFSCFYPSVENPGTFTECSYGPADDWALVSGPSDTCFPYAGVADQAGCPYEPYNLALPGCTASYMYIGETNSGLLKRD
ncbi:hypothetical protein AZE42_11960 [Rhizopogon vesiculosus]|uniref:Uncharacterized protein n=1 Tax=Rhizopogon vesiculosus TaxID=180088 RepID=A0A1J8QVN6_9AGAM|nr:hypothetical protein AZE42_11960 [Rhizopogon vesiculosus]